MFKTHSLGASNFCLGQVVGKKNGFCPDSVVCYLCWINNGTINIGDHQCYVALIICVYRSHHRPTKLNCSKGWLHTRLYFNIYSLLAHELLSLSLSRSLISSLDWFALNSCSFSSSATSLNSIGKCILHALLTSFLVAALNSFTHSTRHRFWGSGSVVESRWCH